MQFKFLSAIIVTICLSLIIIISMQSSAAGVNGSTQNKFPPPLEQFESGIAAMNVQCNQGLQLIIKIENGNPECVKPTTFTHLIAKRWGMAPSIKPVEGNATQLAQNQTATSEARPIIVALWRGDVDQASLYSLFSSFLTDKDYVFPIKTKSLDYGYKLPGQQMAGAGLLSNMNTAVDKYKGKVSWLVYDLEWSPNMPNGPPELQGEYQDYVNSVKQASTIAHDNGFKLLLTPQYSDVQKYDKQFAPYVDMVNLQIPPTVANYVSAVQTATNDIKSVNPKAIVLVQLIPRDGMTKANGDPTSIINAWNSVKNYVDGVFVFYYSTPDPVPILKQFYDGIGLSTG
jgi:hypothetical protein